MKNVLAAVVFLLAASGTRAQIKVGQMAPEISLPNAKDSLVHLSSLKGKVVLVDFWASWCGPCRIANPHVVKLYDKYKGRGFEVFGVSIDSKKSDWIKAIQKDKIKHSQVNDNGGWNANVTFRYGVDAIPATFLLDKKGVVVAIDAEGKNLEDKIKELLKQ